MGTEPTLRARHAARLADRLVSGSRAVTPAPTARGFTLIEIVLAVSILAVVVLLATSALRVGLRAWEAGQRRVGSPAGESRPRRAGQRGPGGRVSVPGPPGPEPAARRAVRGGGGRGALRHERAAARPRRADRPVPCGGPRAARDPTRLRLVERVVPTEEPFAAGPEHRAVAVGRPLQPGLPGRGGSVAGALGRQGSRRPADRGAGRAGRSAPPGRRRPWWSRCRSGSAASDAAGADRVRAASDAGVALIVVLLLLTLLLTIVGEFAQAMRLEAVTARTSAPRSSRPGSPRPRTSAPWPRSSPRSWRTSSMPSGALVFRRLRLLAPQGRPSAWTFRWIRDGSHTA